MKKKSIFFGNKATILGVIIIIFMAFILKSNTDLKERTFTERVFFDGNEYRYEETVMHSPFRFVRARRGSHEGFRVLILRKDKKTEVLKDIYIYIGKKNYLKYSIIE